MKGPFAFVAILVVFGCQEREAPEPVDRAGPLVSLHLGSLQERPGLEPVGFDGQQLYVDPEALISDQGIERVEVSRSGGGVVLDVRLSAEGEDRLRVSTSENIGEPIIVEFRSRVVAAPIIHAAITGGRIQIAIATESQREADQIVAEIRARWPAEQEAGERQVEG